MAGKNKGILTDYAAVLRNRNFTLLWAGQTISWLGDSLYFIALLWLVQEITGSRAMLGVVAAARTLPSLFGFLSGALVDRWDRRTIMVASDLLRAGIVLSVPILWSLHALAPWHLPVVAALLGAVGVFFTPARQALMPEVIGEDELVQANALMTLSMQATMAFGFAIGGVILGYIGIQPLFVFDSLSFLLSAAALAMMRFQPGAVHTGTEAADQPRLLDQIRTGFHFISSSPVLVRLLPLLLGMNFLIQPFLVLLPSWVKDVLGVGPEVFGFLETAQMAGLLLGALMVAPLAQRTHRSTFVYLALFLQSFGLVAFSLTRSVPFAVAGLFAFGFLDSLVMVTLTAYLQSIVPGNMRGRVFGAVETVGQALVPGAQALGGVAGQLIALPVLYGSIGALRALGSVAAWAAPELRQVLDAGSLFLSGGRQRKAAAND